MGRYRQREDFSDNLASYKKEKALILELMKDVLDAGRVHREKLYRMPELYDAINAIKLYFQEEQRSHYQFIRGME